MVIVPKEAIKTQSQEVIMKNEKKGKKKEKE